MATCLSCGGIFNNHFAVNWLQKPSVKEFQISHEHDKTLHRTIAMLHLDTNHKCPINGIFHCRCGYYYHSSIFKAKKPFPHRPQREGASTRYKYRAKNSTNGVGIKTPLQEVYIGGVGSLSRECVYGSLRRKRHVRSLDVWSETR